MKNVLKVCGIIATLAIIGVALSCEVSPDDQVQITITGLPDTYNGKFASMDLGEKNVNDRVATASARKLISGGSVTCYMNDITKGGAFGDAGSYYIILGIFLGETAGTDDQIYFGHIPEKVGLVKGSNSVAASRFSPSIPAAVDPKAPMVNAYGTYKATVKWTTSTTYIETIDLTTGEFKISDNTKTTNPDTLTFKITDWLDASTPAAYSATYPKAYKFIGNITHASENGYVPSGQTAPGTTIAGDVKADGTGTQFYMYLYFKGSGSDMEFIRTRFNKTAAENPDDTVVNQFLNPLTLDPRVYKKDNS